MGLLGSMLYTLTWKERVTPAQLSISALRASARRTSDSAFTGWPTATANAYTGAGTQGRQGGMNLQTCAQLAGWNTPAATDGKGGYLGGQDPQWGALNRQAGRNGTANTALQVNGFWRDADWLYCRDGVWRPVEPGTFPLANGLTNRVGRLRAYGNAIVAPLAQAFIEAAAAAITELEQRRSDPAKASQ